MQAAELLHSASEQVAELKAAGLLLRMDWPRPWHAGLASWLGHRAFVSHEANFAPQRHYVSLVSSAVGRNAQKLPHWPRLLDSALRSVARDSQTLLISPGTTLAEEAAEFARRAGVDWVSLRCCDELSWPAWLDGLRRIATENPGDGLRSRIFLSPIWGAASASELEPTLADVPLRDRCAFGLADSVLVLSARRGGNIQRLMDGRLADRRFPSASVFLALPEPAKQRPTTCQAAWLDQGAVGWYVPPHVLRGPSIWTRCRHAQGIATQQITFPWPGRFTTSCTAQSENTQPCIAQPRPTADANSESTWLVHCTRGGIGTVLEGSRLAGIADQWLEGAAADSHPLLTLHKIVADHKLRGFARITRTAARSISFSEVPLPELLRRRRFRPHLGRWDWEPYGVMIRRAALQALGARPVIYGTDSDYAALPVAEQPFFQPSGTSRTLPRGQSVRVATASQPANDWSAEREWRLLGDLDLRRLPCEAVLFFAKTQQDALELSRHCPWLVVTVGNLLTTDKPRRVRLE